MAKRSCVPHYLETAVVGSGDIQAEVLLSLVEATEAQTEAIERASAALEGIAEHLRRMAPPSEAADPF